MKISDAHPSHDLFEYDLDTDSDSTHANVYKCRTCEKTACRFCLPPLDSGLAVPCIGFSTWDSMTVFGNDGITLIVRRSRTGWF